MIVITDFNNDNQSDIAVTNYNTNNVLILIGYYVTPSTRPTTYFVGLDSRPTAVAIYDFNNDGILDIAVSVQCGIQANLRSA
jgi:hypothetical protein